MLYSILAGFVVAIALIFTGKFFKLKWSFLLTALPLGLFVYFVSYIPEISSGATIYHSLSWIPSFGVDLSFQLDGLSLLFSLMITFLWVFKLIYGCHVRLGTFR